MSDRTYTPAQMADAVQRMMDDGTYMPWDVLPKIVAYLRSPAPGAAEMREAAYCTLCGRETPHSPVPDQNPPTFTATALPTPEVPESKEAKWHAADIARIVQLEQTEDRLRLCLEIAADAMKKNPMFGESSRDDIINWLHRQASAFEARDRGEEDA